MIVCKKPRPNRMRFGLGFLLLLFHKIYHFPVIQVRKQLFTLKIMVPFSSSEYGFHSIHFWRCMRSSPSRIGIYNIQMNLVYLYENQCQLFASSSLGEGLTVTLMLLIRLPGGAGAKPEVIFSDAT